MECNPFHTATRGCELCVHGRKANQYHTKRVKKRGKERGKRGKGRRMSASGDARKDSLIVSFLFERVNNKAITMQGESTTAVGRNQSPFSPHRVAKKDGICGLSSILVLINNIHIVIVPSSSPC
jgi:hypothetical protein